MTSPGLLMACDVGGTKTLVGLYEREERAPARPRVRNVSRWPTLDYESFDQLLTAAFDRHAGRPRIAAAAVGVAGPVRNQRAVLTNVPWQIDATAVAARLSLPAHRVRLMNDVEAMGHAVPHLTADERWPLQHGRPDPNGAAALIAPGTGLGESVLHRVDGALHPSATEAGHADFAPRTPQDLDVLQTLTRRAGRASCEGVLSGPGLLTLHAITHRAGPCLGLPPAGRAPQPETVTANALDRRCERCGDAVRLFLGALGAEAGNLGLRALATAGVYVAGGIVPRLLPALPPDPFLTAFRDKAPMERLMADIPVYVVRADDLALLGAAVVAARLAP